MKAQRDESRVRILLGYNTSGGTVALRPMFQCCAVWTPSGLPDISGSGTSISTQFLLVGGTSGSQIWLTSGNVSMYDITVLSFSRCIHAKHDVLKRVSLREIRKVTGYGVHRGSIHNEGMHDNTGSWTHSTNQKFALLS